jgi:hypothetical protein
MIEKKMVLYRANVANEPLLKSTAVFRTKGVIPETFVTVESMNHEGIKRIIAYDEVFISIEDANVIRCTCIAKELVDPKCPEHGD